jgi:hypothetical protein
VSSRGWQRATLSALAAVILYCNAAVILKPFASRGLTPSLPIPDEVADQFWMFGVFSGYERVNREVVVKGLAHYPDGHQRWIRLDARDFFPFDRGERLRRVWAYRQVGRLTPSHAQQQRQVMAKLKARENRRHPERKVTKVLVYEETWPRGTRSYNAGRRSGTVHTQVWYSE